MANFGNPPIKYNDLSDGYLPVREDYAFRVDLITDPGSSKPRLAVSKLVGDKWLSFNITNDVLEISSNGEVIKQVQTSELVDRINNKSDDSDANLLSSFIS